jgi:hypothetical protein
VGGTTRPLLLGGAVGAVIFVGALLVEGVVRDGYDPLRLQVSYLSLGELGWIQTLSFLACGVLIIGFAVALRHALRDGVGAIAGPTAIGILGIGLVVAGFFPTMPAFGYPPGTAEGFPTTIPWSAYIHVIGALCFFGGMASACVVMARRFRRQGRRAWAVYSAASGLLVILFFAASSADSSGAPFFPAFAGLLQRLSIIAGLSWIVALGMSLRAQGRNPRLSNLGADQRPG